MSSSVDKKKAANTYIEDNEMGTKTDPSGSVVLVKTEDSRFGAYIAQKKTSAFSKSLLKLYPILFVAFMNSAANGFDGNTFGGVSALPDFQHRFGTSVASNDGFLAAIYILGILFSD
jgi:hypothetical protein